MLCNHCWLLPPWWISSLECVLLFNPVCWEKGVFNIHGKPSPRVTSYLSYIMKALASKLSPQHISSKTSGIYCGRTAYIIGGASSGTVWFSKQMGEQWSFRPPPYSPSWSHECARFMGWDSLGSQEVAWNWVVFVLRKSLVYIHAVEIFVTFSISVAHFCLMVFLCCCNLIQ